MPPAPSPRLFAVDGVLVALTLAMTLLFQPPESIETESRVGALGVAAPGAAASVAGAASTGGPVAVAGSVDRTRVLRGGDGTVRVELKITGEDRPRIDGPRTPTDLVVVLDRSGSMDGSKIASARDAALDLIDLLTPEDRFALVTYSGRSSIAVPLAPAVRDAAVQWKRIVGHVEAGGSTNIGDALDDADAILAQHQTPGRAARVVLISDGLPTAGDTSFEGLVHRARRAVRDEYVLSAVGVGADFNEHLMAAVADAGTGNYYFLERGARLAGVFADEFASSREQVASGVRVHVRSGAGMRVVDAAGYPLDSEGDTVTFHPGALFAGQERTIWVTLQAATSATGAQRLPEFEVSFTHPEGRRGSVRLSTLPDLACVEDPAEFARGIDKSKWEKSQIQDSWNEVRTKVARQVQLGNREAAVMELQQYKDETAALNAVVGSTAVDANLAEVDALAGDVEEAFKGADDEQRRKRSSYSKSQREDARDLRRSGAKK